MNYIVERTGTSVLSVRHNIAAGWEQSHLLLADVHFDSPHCRRDLLRKLLDQAQDRGAGICIIGDWFDAMQSRADKRSNKSDLMPRHKTGHYLDELVDETVEYLTPYRNNLLFISKGNHETAITKYLETDLLARVCRGLDCNHMGYAGFVRWMFAYITDAGGRSCKSSVTMWFDHGRGGAAPVTKGVMRAERESAYVDADVFVGGHVHKSWAVHTRAVRLSQGGKVKTVERLHLCIPTLKDEFDLDAGEGFHIERGGRPEILGGYWLRFWYDAQADTRVAFDAHRAF